MNERTEPKVEPSVERAYLSVYHRKICEAGGPSAIAKRVGCCKGLVSGRWQGKGIVPTNEAHKAALEREFGITAADYTAADRPPTAAAPPLATGLGTEGHLAAQVDRMAALAGDKSLTADLKLKAETSLRHALKDLARVRGEGGELTEARILASPAFRRLWRRFEEVLGKYPEAARAVGLALASAARESEP